MAIANKTQKNWRESHNNNNTVKGLNAGESVIVRVGLWLPEILKSKQKSDYITFG